VVERKLVRKLWPNRSAVSRAPDAKRCYRLVRVRRWPRAHDLAPSAVGRFRVFLPLPLSLRRLLARTERLVPAQPSRTAATTWNFDGALEGPAPHAETRGTGHRHSGMLPTVMRRNKSGQKKLHCRWKRRIVAAAR